MSSERAAKRARIVFAGDADSDLLALDDGPWALATAPSDPPADAATRAKLASRISSEYRDAQVLPSALLAQQGGAGPARPGAGPAAPGPKRLMIEGSSPSARMIDDVAAKQSSALTLHRAQEQPSLLQQSLIRRKEARAVKPDYHAQWKLTRVISGHLGWVRSVCVEPGNQWFATGAGDRIIKIWDLASGQLKLSLTGHISTVRGLAVSPRHPYLFSCAEDKMVKCCASSKSAM